MNYLGKIILNTSCHWTISTKFMVEFIDHIHFGLCLILSYLWPRKCFVLSPKPSLILVDLLILLISSCVLLIVGTSDDPICVHFAFQRKILHNALSMGELSYIIQNTHIYASFVWSISGFMCLEPQSFRFGILCHHEKFGEFGFLLEPCSFWELVLSHSLLLDLTILE